MRRGWIALLAVLIASSAQAAPLAAYGQLPTLDQLAISPDGKNLAYIISANGSRKIAIQQLDGHKPLAAIDAGVQKLRDLSWADNDTLLITFSGTGVPVWGSGLQEVYATVSFSVATKKFVGMLKHVNDALHVVAGLPQPRTLNGRTVLFIPGISVSGLYGVLTIFSEDPASGDATLVEAGTKYTRGFLVDESGNVVVRVEYLEKDKHWSLQLKRDGKWTEIYGVNAAIESPEILGWGADGKALVLREVIDGEEVFKQLDLASGTWREPLHFAKPVNEAIGDPATHRIIGGMAIGEHREYQFFNPVDQGAWDSVANAFPGEDVALVSWSNDRKRIVVRVDGQRDGSAFEMVDLGAGRAEMLGQAYEAIAPADVADVKLITYAAADGLKIPAYLTLPSGRPAKGLPLVVLPHGGPASRDMPGFDWWSQALASRGYAVLRPQFRGSDGFGWAFLAAGFGEWGRKMQTDLSDGVRYLVGQGIVDPKRVCIVGASYGGYAALAGATMDRGVYRCAVAVAGVSDPSRMLGHPYSSDTDDRGLRYVLRFFGTTGYDDPKLDEISPLKHADDADIPILLVHGTNDTVVDYSQSYMMYTALNRNGKSVSLTQLDSEDHWLSQSATRQKMLDVTVKFLEANNPPN